MQVIASGPYAGMISSTIRFCELPVAGYVSQPVNTWSNLAYVFVGLYLLYRSSKTKSHFLFLFSVFTILIGVTSFYFHMTSTFLGGSLDWGAMVLLATLQLVFGLYRLGDISKKHLVGGFLLIAGLVYAIHFPIVTIFGLDLGSQIFAVEATAVGLMELYLTRKHKYELKNVRIGIILLIVAMLFWLSDYFYIWCDPTTMHYINGHGIWHVLTALAIYYIFRHFELMIQMKKARSKFF